MTDRDVVLLTNSVQLLLVGTPGSLRKKYVDDLKDMYEQLMSLKHVTDDDLEAVHPCTTQILEDIRN
jgi:hypothetical protein